MSGYHFMRTGFVFVALMTLLASPIRPKAQETTSWENRFREEAPRAWNTCQARAGRLQGGFHAAYQQIIILKDIIIDRDYNILHVNGCLSFLMQSNEESGTPDSSGKLGVLNGRYGFSLERPAPDGPWMLHQLDKDPRDGLKINPRPDDRGEMWATCPITFSIMFDELRLVATEPGFSLKRITSQARDNVELAKVEFAYHAPEDQPRIPSIEGWVLYDPAHLWVIREFDVRLNWSQAKMEGETQATYEYEEGQDGFPLVKRITQHLALPPKPYDGHHVIDFDFHEGTGGVLR